MQHNDCLKITLVKSLIGRLPGHVRTAQALGLRKMHASIIIRKSPTLMGMVNKLHYLLKVEEVSHQ
jgi:large subunit ribosomal protein L30